MKRRVLIFLALLILCCLCFVLGALTVIYGSEIVGIHDGGYSLQILGNEFIYY
jgi:hypothetical protein